MKDKSLTFASIAAAGLASLCCIGPLAAVALGIGSFSAAAFFEGLRPYLLGLTALLLVGAFYLNYRKRPEADCEDGTCAVSPEKKRKQTMLLWLATGAVAALAAFPHYSAVFWGESNQGGTALAASRSAETSNQATFDVEGMTCAGCAATLESALRDAPGVDTATVSLEAKTAVVSFDSSTTDTQKLTALMTEHGFTGKARKVVAADGVRDQRFAIEGMTCPSCALGIQATMSRREGVKEVEVNYDDKNARVLFDPAKVSAGDLIASFKELGYEATPQSGS